ncbi:MAG: hypothetical protein WBD55_12700 [Dehalococcoidia bacterium]
MTSENETPQNGQPPRAVLYALYAILVLVFIAVLVVVSVYGT